MLATALSATLLGLDGTLIRVEVRATRGIASFELVGLAEAAVRESRVRVRSALAQLGVFMSEHCIIVNLAPADVRKTCASFDLAIAAGTLAALGRVPVEALEGVLFLGELSLSGAVQSARGVLPQLLGARREGIKTALVPRANAAEAALIAGIEVRTVANIGDLYRALLGEVELPLAAGDPPQANGPNVDDLADVRGQASARRALEICAAGSHNLVMIGPETRHGARSCRLPPHQGSAARHATRPSEWAEAETAAAGPAGVSCQIPFNLFPTTGEDGFLYKLASIVPSIFRSERGAA